MARRPSFALAAVVCLVGFLLVTVGFAAKRDRVAAAPRRAELIKLIDQRRSSVNDLDRAVTDLRSQLARDQARASRLGARDRAQTDRVDRLGREAGTVALQGPAVIVRLADSSRPPPTPEEAGAYRIHDVDLQLVANALFNAGAEAVAINESRLVATTPIRAAGETIVVNFRPLTPPYEIVAIGADRTRFDASAIVQRFKGWNKLFGLGLRVTTDKSAVVPPFTGRVTITDATPVNG